MVTVNSSTVTAIVGLALQLALAMYVLAHRARRSIPQRVAAVLLAVTALAALLCALALAVPSLPDGHSIGAMHFSALDLGASLLWPLACVGIIQYYVGLHAPDSN